MPLCKFINLQEELVDIYLLFLPPPKQLISTIKEGKVRLLVLKVVWI